MEVDKLLLLYSISCELMRQIKEFTCKTDLNQHVNIYSRNSMALTQTHTCKILRGGVFKCRFKLSFAQHFWISMELNQFVKNLCSQNTLLNA